METSEELGAASHASHALGRDQQNIPIHGILHRHHGWLEMPRMGSVAKALQHDPQQGFSVEDSGLC